MHTNILECVGETPLVLLNKLTAGLTARVALKLESLNPGGSVKDRVGMAMITEAERSGSLRPGGTIIEATAGNTGVGLAMVAAVRGYRCIFVLPDKMSQEKVSLLRAYGAEVVITPTNVPPDSPESYNGVADRLVREIPGAWRPNQFANLANPEIHYSSTGPEVWRQTQGQLTTFVAGVGTGGTLSGVGRYLKERNPHVRIIGADPEGSVLSGGTPGSWKVEGIGEDFVPQTLNAQVVDEWVRVSDAEAFHTARELARQEGILVGGSTGVNLTAALRYAKRLTSRDLIVTIACDTGRNYLSKFFDDSWLHQHRLSFTPPPAFTINTLLSQRGPRRLVSVSPQTTIAQTFQIMGEAGISQVPVLDEGKSVGSIQEVTLARVAHDSLPMDSILIHEVMARPLPSLSATASLDEAYRLLMSGITGILVDDGTEIIDIVTRIDLVRFWSIQPRNGSMAKVA
jgi:cystathionine beta-synthase